MFGIRSAKIVFALSLLLSCLTFGAGDPGAQLRELRGKAPEQQLELLNKWADNGSLDPDLAKKVSQINDQLARWSANGRPVPKDWRAHQVQDCIDKLTLGEQMLMASASDNSVALAKKIKSSPVYRDPGPKQSTNWLSSAFERLNNIHPSCNCKQPMPNAPNVPRVGSWFVTGIYIVLFGALAGFIIFAVSRYSWSKKLNRKAKALLDEDEPERSLDEWLEMADKLEGEGRFREAVRCLYLACLLKIDEARIARFERSQTNWEHLERIEASSARPANLEFREPTKAFDVIWYGMRVNGSEDVLRFRNWYREVTQAVRPREAA